MEEGSRKLKMYILFNGNNSWKVARWQLKFVTVKDYYLQVLFESLFCSAKILNVAMVRNFRLVLGQMLNHTVYNPLVLYTVVS
jgi:hypothetical protein